MSLPNSIFGIDHPSFVKDAATVDLEHFEVTRDEPEDFSKKHQSVLTGKRTYVDKGEHWIFEGILNLFKYEANALTKYNEIWGYRKAIIDKLYRRSDNEAIKDVDNNFVSFKLVHIVPMHVDGPEMADRLLLRFESVDFVDISKSTTVL
jgi:hypothetical protein